MWLYGGLTLSIPTLLVIGSMTYVYVRDVDVTPHKPAWWLVSELDWDPTTRSRSAFGVIKRRLASRPTAYPKIGAGLVKHGGGDHR